MEKREWSDLKNKKELRSLTSLFFSFWKKAIEENLYDFWELDNLWRCESPILFSEKPERSWTDIDQK